MVTLLKIKKAIEKMMRGREDSQALDLINDAIDALRALCDALDDVSVCGRENVDAMLGCMVGLDMIIGKEDNDGRDQED